MCWMPGLPRFLSRPELHPQGWNPQVQLPYQLSRGDFHGALQDLYQFLNQANSELTGRGWERLEDSMMPANFSGLISDFVVSRLARNSANLVKNRYPSNGNPDLLPRGHYASDAVQHGDEGVEVKASRSDGGWQGHNIE
jgi:hypothetical protein